MDLDRPERFARADPSGALRAVLAAPEQWLLAGEVSARRPPRTTSVVAVGMGGSGIAGDVLAALAADRLDVPVVAHADADLPAFVGPGTLVLAVSYSGASAETVGAARLALEAGAHVIGISAGGPLADLLSEAGQPVVTVPGGQQPRHALGWLAAAALAVCGLAEAAPDAAKAQRRVATECAPHVPTADNRAKRLGAAIAASGLVVAWGSGRIGDVLAKRLACQVNEHAKLPSHRAALPEVAHNEVVGWEGAADGAGARGLVVIRDPWGESSVAHRLAGPALERVRDRFAWCEDLRTPDGPPLARLAAVAMLIDLATVYAALARGVDPTPIDATDALKAALAATTVEDER